MIPSGEKSGEDYRQRLPTVGVADSQESVDPTSSNSVVNGSNNGKWQLQIYKREKKCSKQLSAKHCLCHMHKTCLKKCIFGIVDATEVYSSVETVNECDAMIRAKNVPIQTRPKPKLTSTKSLPNVHERMKKRETKMQ